MKIKYTGPRPHITHHGISFKDGKEDKYVYLMIGVQILKAIDHDFGEHKVYSYDINTKRIPDEQILQILLGYEQNLEHEAKKEAEDYAKKLDEEIEDVKARADLNDVEKETWLANLDVMREYRVQRAINKIYYMHNIHEIARIIKRERIKEIDTPFYEKYWHVLRTVQGELAQGKSAIRTELKIEKNARGEMVAKLLIQNI